jgi:hypothetical protein
MELSSESGEFMTQELAVWEVIIDHQYYTGRSVNIIIANMAR